MSDTLAAHAGLEPAGAAATEWSSISGSIVAALYALATTNTVTCTLSVLMHIKSTF